jgi:hypothetical protein
MLPPTYQNGGALVVTLGSNLGQDNLIPPANQYIGTPAVLGGPGPDMGDPYHRRLFHGTPTILGHHQNKLGGTSVMATSSCVPTYWDSKCRVL